jgi:hypothetical protein
MTHNDQTQTQKTTTDLLDRTIRSILESPQTDLSRVSMKVVREQLPRKEPRLTSAWIGQNEDMVDRRIVDIFEQVNASRDY